MLWSRRVLVTVLCINEPGQRCSGCGAGWPFVRVLPCAALQSCHSLREEFELGPGTAGCTPHTSRLLALQNLDSYNPRAGFANPRCPQSLDPLRHSPGARAVVTKLLTRWAMLQPSAKRQ